MTEKRQEAGRKSISSLAEEVVERIGRPLDEWAVAAALESGGMRDADAVQDFDKEDIFDLAEDIYARCQAREWEPVEDKGPKEPVLGQKLGRFLKFYLHGLFFALPMAGQIFGVLFLGYSLWASLEFTEREGTVVAFGTILSLVVTGGFVQAIGYKGLFYVEQESYVLAKEVCLRFIRTGTLTVIEVGLALCLANLVSPFFSRSMLAIALMYYLLLSELWLCLAVLYMLKERVATLMLTLLGTIVVYLAMSFAPWGIYASHAIALIVSDILVLAWGYGVLSRRARGVSKELKLARLPRDPILTYSVAPYFVYGALYFAFLFVDRVTGWSAGDMPPPYVFWFRTPYEWGLDFALLSLVLTIAVLEYTINEFSSLIIPVQKRFRALHIPEHNAYFRRFYHRQLVLLLVVALVSALGAYWVAAELGDRLPFALTVSRGDDAQTKTAKDSDTTAGNVFDDRIIAFVFAGGVVGYGLLVWGLLSAMLFFSLSRPGFVLKAIGLALAVNLTTGLVLSRVVSYEYSVIGLAAGSLVFGAMTSWYAVRVLNRLDYYYYSAY